MRAFSTRDGRACGRFGWRARGLSHLHCHRVNRCGGEVKYFEVYMAFVVAYLSYFFFLVTLRWLSEGHCRGGRLFFISSNEMTKKVHS